MSEKWPAMRLAATVPLPCCRGCCCLCLRIQPQLLLDAVSGTHALDQSCEDDDAADKLQCQCVVCVCVCGVCGVCCICIDDNYMSATATPDDDADDYGAPAGYRTIFTKCRHCFSSVSSLSFICPCVHPCSPSQSVCQSVCLSVRAPLSPCARRILISPLAGP